MGAGQGAVNMFSSATRAHSPLCVQIYLYTGTALQIFIQSLGTYLPTSLQNVSQQLKRPLVLAKRQGKWKVSEQLTGHGIKRRNKQVSLLPKANSAYFKHSDQIHNDVLKSYSSPVKSQNLENKLSKSVWKTTQNVFVGCVLHAKH